MTHEILINTTCYSSDARRYLKLRFDVPEGMEQVAAEYSYPRFVEKPAPESAGDR